MPVFSNNEIRDFCLDHHINLLYFPPIRNGLITRNNDVTTSNNSIALIAAQPLAVVLVVLSVVVVVVAGRLTS
jgi:hypothetical protein